MCVIEIETNKLDWKVAGITAESSSFRIQGIDVWEHKWHKMSLKTFNAPHPQYPNQMHLMTPYYIDYKGNRIVFAVSEVSANVYSFYVPESINK